MLLCRLFGWKYMYNTMYFVIEFTTKKCRTINDDITRFQSRFRELANTFAVSERAVRDLPVGGHRTAEEVNAALDKVETCAQSLAHDGARARELSKMGQDLLQDHNFAADCVQPKCNELKMMCQKLEHMVRATIGFHQFL